MRVAPSSPRAGVRAAANCRPEPVRAAPSVLPSENRLRRSADFAAVLRGGSRSRRGHLVVHIAPESAPSSAPLVGFVVGKAVGGSVVRHRVSRRLRHQMAMRVGRLPASSATVIRALPGAEHDSSARLGSDLDSALARMVGAR